MKKSFIVFGLLFLTLVDCVSLQACDDQPRFMLTPLAFLYHQHQRGSSFQSAFNPCQHGMRTNCHHQNFGPLVLRQSQQDAKTSQEKIKKNIFFIQI